MYTLKLYQGALSLRIVRNKRNSRQILNLRTGEVGKTSSKFRNLIDEQPSVGDCSGPMHLKSEVKSSSLFFFFS